MAVSTPFLVSSPGKVIIFGEHAAVYCKPAIAAALSLRTYLLASHNGKEDTVSLEFPDIKFSHSWRISDLPWDVVEKFTNGSTTPIPTDELVSEIVSALAVNMSSITSPLHYTAAHAFLYLYVSLCHKNTPSTTFSVRSTLPIGAGLGSSASIAVCLASSLGLLGGHLEPATQNEEDISVENENSNFIDAWSFMGEKCIHGNPSGIDNAVATHGGAVMFQRTGSSSPSIRTSMRNFPSLRLLLTNTLTPRRTADLVGNVSRLSNEYPSTTDAILDAIANLTKEGYNLMIKPYFGAEERAKLSELIKINHGLLVALGVSHPTLEKIKLISDEHKIGETKLTGAGGGGCAITLLKDDVDEANVIESTKLFEAEGFETFKTTLGGKGVGALIPKGSDADREIFSVEKFLNFSNREEIQKTLSPACIDGWKYW